MKENYEEFVQWLKKFHADKGFGIVIYNEPWFNSVQKSHAKLRDFLNDNTEVTWDVQIKAKTGATNNEEAKKILNKIKDLLPEGLGDRNMTYADLLSPVIQKGTHRALKTSKFLTRRFEEYTPSYDLGFKEKQKEFQKQLSALALLWNKQKTTEAIYQVKLDTAAKAFVNLGYYGPDSDSCFKQSGCGEASKKNLAIAKNSYIITVNDGNKCMSRMWGFCNNNFDTYNVCNLYQKGTNEGNVLSAVQQYFSQLLGVEDGDIKIFEDQEIDTTEDNGELESENDNHVIIPEGIYHNAYGTFTFTTKSRIQQQTMVLEEV
jgi:hypothetical protein